MARNLKIKDTMVNAEKVATVWKENPELTMGKLKYSNFAAIHSAVDQVIKDSLQRKAELIGLMKQRDDQLKQMQDLVSRFRSVARAHFGPDSKEYAQVGGTPLSARKPRTRKTEPDSKAEPVPAGK